MNGSANINYFFIEFAAQLRRTEVIVNTHTQDLRPTIQSGLQPDLILPNMSNATRFGPSLVKGVPAEIWKNIQSATTCTLTYHFPPSMELIDKRSITFVVAIQGNKQEACSPKKIKEINACIRQCLTWLYIAQKNAKKNKCNESPLVVYLFLSPLPKMLPSTTNNTKTKNKEKVTLDWCNANSAFTMVCSDTDKAKAKVEARQIIIFRQEEWFKVFVHETFHNYGFDFSGANDELLNQSAKFTAKKLYPIRSEMNVYEAYTECWARMLSMVFSCVYGRAPESDAKYLSCLNGRFAEEIGFSFFQAGKVLEYMDILSYGHLIRGQAAELYREKTSILAYYIITLVLFSNYPAFIAWCLHQNKNHGPRPSSSLSSSSSSSSSSSPSPSSSSSPSPSPFHLSDYIVFHQNKTNMDSFLTFLQTHYKTPALTKNIDAVIRDIHGTKRKTLVHKTMRMTYK